ncbi:hypothetical protein B0H14DRAFT_3121695 [Mycena olivaceomarginata]|nr:hypothetical protein B0H14DRAFT_3121695 [Mycena olivaceomarginata]
MIPSLKPRKLGRKGTTDIVKLDIHDIASLEKNALVPKTDDSAKFALGNTTATIKSVFHNKTFVESAADIPDNTSFGLILVKTSFYAESSGQEYDTGVNVQIYNGYVLHVGHLKYGHLAIGSEVVSSYDELRRWPSRNNHTATHILNFCLNVRVYSKELDLQTAHKIPSLRPVFGESYPDPIRVVTLEYTYEIDEIAKDITNPKWRNMIHVAKTGDIKDFVIIEESGIAKGIRRITAVTGHEAQDVTRLAQALKARLDQLELLSGQEKDSGLKTPSVELGQADISVVLKAELKERLAVVRKAFDKQIKEKEAAANKEALDKILQHFKEDDDSLEAYIAIVDVDANAKASFCITFVEVYQPLSDSAKCCRPREEIRKSRTCVQCGR